VTEEADNGGFLSHSTELSLDNSLPSFQEYAPRDGCIGKMLLLGFRTGLSKTFQLKV